MVRSDEENCQETKQINPLKRSHIVWSAAMKVPFVDLKVHYDSIKEKTGTEAGHSSFNVHRRQLFEMIRVDAVQSHVNM